MRVPESFKRTGRGKWNKKYKIRCRGRSCGKDSDDYSKSEFRDEEYLHPKEEFLKNGHEVITASSTLGECTGRFGAKVTPDIDFKELTTDDFDALVLLGAEDQANTSIRL